jgi:hypothetical protein
MLEQLDLKEDNAIDDEEVINENVQWLALV